MKFSVIFGTRPEIIKLALVIKKLCHSNRDVDIVFTGQHYDYIMSEEFIEELGLPEPDFRLNCSRGSHAEQTSSLLLAIERYLKEAKSDMVVVQGDTNTTLAGALAASKLNIPIAHIEAGCRSFDMKMPEEINRRIVDVISSLLFAPMQRAVQNLRREGVGKDKIEMVGSTLGEICREYCVNALTKSSILNKLGLEPKAYAVLTTHRQENVDVKENLENIVSALPLISTTVVFPIHPRTAKNLDEFGLLSTLHRIPNVVLSEPLGYLDFLTLLSQAQIVMTDSGGVQEESTIFHIPCVTLLEATPWWETVEQGANILVGAKNHQIVDTVNRILGDEDLYGQMSHAEVFPVMDSSDLIVERLCLFSRAK
ncbi:MAG: UDP-2,3-diacetamido-2,3-dideoxy-D-glucuronate 2-epimerase [Syntrophomonadaceae bacterium]|nr:UDP-2,3-diacetamido-2,3-dideoxy-D-glucuronate 2-epimerase [Bacillota bacterium]MBT9146914.1 UDP-2,3-diacetamido-2,3-dideoxy-D-glucuronate 2-epimerase [Bacillota bacterium]